MPQLDSFSYFSQFFWLCVFFFGFYILVLNNANGFVGISRILKLRTGLFSSVGSSLDGASLSGLDSILVKVFSGSVSYLSSFLLSVSSWCNSLCFSGGFGKVSLLCCLGEMIGSGVIEGQIFVFFDSSYRSFSHDFFSAPVKNDIMLIHALKGQDLFF